MKEKLEKLLKPLIEKVNKNMEPNFMYILIPKLISKKSIVYMNMRSDFIFIKSCINELIQFQNPSIISRSLWTTTIALYGRQFTDSTKSSSPKLEVKDCFSDSNSDLQNIHNRIMELRHNFISHRGENYEEYGICFMKLSKHENQIEDQVFVEQIQLENPLGDELIEVEKLIDHLIKIVEEKFNKSSQKAVKRMLAEFNDEELSMFASLIHNYNNST